jgi:hypothetical protein
MEPPLEIEKVFLKQSQNKYQILFKTALKDPKFMESELSKDSFLGYVLGHSSKVKHTLDTTKKVIRIYDIKVLNIIKSSTLTSKVSNHDKIEIIIHYDSIYSKDNSDSRVNISGITDIFKNNELLCNIQDMKITCTICNGSFGNKDKYLEFNLSYTNSATDINDFQKKNIAHSFRNLFVPFKLAISK